MKEGDAYESLLRVKVKALYDSWNYHIVPLEYFNSNLNTFTLTHF